MPRVRSSLIPTLGLVVGLIAWEAITRVLNVPLYLIPPPSAVLQAIFQRPTIPWLAHSLATLYETMAGFALAVAFGIVSAIAIVYSRILERLLYPYILIAQMLPKVAIAPLLMIWFGYGITPKIVVAFLVAFFPMVIDTATGLKAVEPELMDLIRSLRATSMQEFVKVRLPNALPYVFSGLKVSITLAVVGAVVAEFVGSSTGLGYLILVANTYVDTPMAFGGLLLISLMGILLFYAVVAIEKIVMPWQESKIERAMVY